MNAMDLHNNEEVFPNPFQFNPDRWLVADTKKMDKYYVPFCRGTRSCTGIKYAYTDSLFLSPFPLLCTPLVQSRRIR